MPGVELNEKAIFNVARKIESLQARRADAPAPCRTQATRKVQLGRRPS
jgi:hypothetical protein